MFIFSLENLESVGNLLRDLKGPPYLALSLNFITDYFIRVNQGFRFSFNNATEFFNVNIIFCIIVDRIKRRLIDGGELPEDYLLNSSAKDEFYLPHTQQLVSIRPIVIEAFIG